MIETVENWRWLLFALLAAAALSDIRSLRIPNAIPAGIALSAAFVLLVSKASLADYGTAASSGLVGLAVGYAFYSFGLMGAGDGKLFAAAATWFTLGSLLVASLWVSLAGLAVAFALLLVRTLRNRGSSGHMGGAVKSALKTPVPYGLAIALGFVAAAQQSAAG